MALKFIERRAHERIGEIGPADHGANEIVCGGEFQQPAGLFQAGAAHHYDRPIEAIAFENGKQQGREELGCEVLVGIDARKAARVSRSRLGSLT